MLLNKIEIRNFRSIESIDICPKPTCQGFVGLNESGKSNILSAIALLHPDSTPSNRDIRNTSSEDDLDKSSCVRFFFKLTDTEMLSIIESLKESLYYEKSLPTITIKNKTLKMDDFFITKNIALYICDIKKTDKYAQYFSLDEAEIVPIEGLLKKISDDKETLLLNSGETIDIQSIRFVAADCIAESEEDAFEICTTDDLNTAFGRLLANYVKQNLPILTYWRFENKYLLPSSISLEEFSKDSNISIPLKAMFKLAEYQNIESVLTDALSKPDGVLEGILERVSISSTEYLRKVWNSHESVCFKLRRRNDDTLSVFIEDSEQFFDVDQRSDGFKRFITFLLTLSAQVSKGDMENTIIVIDEPDIGIHILGQKDLLSELLKISEKNLVFYSTHSIFMIDRENTKRHFIVKKNDVTTTIEQASDSNYFEDEVILNALGTSTFEALKERNIVFEGWTDKKVYELALTSKRFQMKSRFIGIGYVYSGGLNRIINIAKILELANRKYLVVSDSDEPALKMKRSFIEGERCSGEWYLYDDFIKGVHTLEDFIKHKALEKSIEKVRKKYKGLGALDYEQFSTKTFKREKYIKSWIKRHIKDDAVAKEAIVSIKEHLYANIKVSDIEKIYYVFLTKLAEKLDA